MSKKELLVALALVGGGIVVAFAAWTMIGPTVVAAKNNIVPIRSTAA